MRLSREFDVAICLEEGTALTLVRVDAFVEPAEERDLLPGMFVTRRLLRGG